MKVKSLVELETILSRLPGVSRKSAEKIAHFLAKSSLEFISEFSRTLTSLPNEVKRCKQCNHLGSSEFCQICQDKSRKKILVVVQSSLDIYRIEASESIRPYYYVLENLLSLDRSLANYESELQPFSQYADNFPEVVLALSSNLEGLVTANLIRKMLDNRVKVTQLAQGLPLGSILDYVDNVTLKSAFENRKEIK